jgi:hypothetical protein
MGLLVYVKGGIYYGISYRVWAVAFAAVWLISFSLAWQIVVVPFHAISSK